MQDSENEDSYIDGHIRKVTRNIEMINRWKLKHSHLSDIFEEDIEYADSIEIPDREELKKSEQLREFVLISTKLEFIIGKIRRFFENSNIDGLIKKVTHQLSIVNACRKKYANLNEIFEQDFQYTDSILIPTSKTLQCPTDLVNFRAVAMNIKSIVKKITDYIQGLKLESQMIELMSIQLGEDPFIKRNDTEDVDYNFLVINLNKQVKSLTKEMIQLKTSMEEKDSTMTKLVSEVLVLNQTVREKNDEIAKLKLQTTNKRWSPSYLNTKKESKQK